MVAITATMLKMYAGSVCDKLASLINASYKDGKLLSD